MAELKQKKKNTSHKMGNNQKIAERNQTMTKNYQEKKNNNQERTTDCEVLNTPTEEAMSEQAQKNGLSEMETNQKKAERNQTIRENIQGKKKSEQERKTNPKDVKALNKGSLKEIINYIVSIATLVVSIVALVTSCSALNVSNASKDFDIKIAPLDISVKEAIIDSDQYVIECSFSHGNVNDIYYAVIGNEDIVYEHVEASEIIMDSTDITRFSLRLAGKDSLTNSNKVGQFAIIFFDDNANPSVYYFIRTFLADDPSHEVKFLLQNGDDVIDHSTDQLKMINCRLINENTVRKALDELTMVTVSLNNNELQYAIPSESEVMENIEKILSDCH